MKSKIIAIIVSAVIFILVLWSLSLIKKDGSNQEQTNGADIVEVAEGEACKPDEGRGCKEGFSCEKGVCFPRMEYQEIIDPEEEKDLYDVAKAGPFEKDYILHVDRLVVAENLYVWIGKRKEPFWFKARREKELRPYEIKVPAGNRIVVKLSNQSKKKPAEFRGKIYLTKP